ncbi:ATP-dependent Clp protease, putative [Plasmodium gallinaceum]|uniref:ATP-dependent Clp protease, putative n=1 Tax=Plasmodium gallinaceum TaxID=5849 RepID=A0A1J1GSW5_PLAGA|nr:ATP-dependent Clp protease, putative [Plasmodium gallinaceum]CRG95588.1 ATP-dependent Clp protease, putative [Plasmodium gallinaceum]
MNVLYSLLFIFILKIVKNIHIRKKINFLNNSYKINKKETINFSRNFRKVRNRNSKLHMSLFEKYDEKCIKALIIAREVAKNDDENEILLKHLLIAIVKTDSDLIENVLKYFNISLTKFLDKFNNMEISKLQKENNKKDGYNEAISYNILQNNTNENTKKKHVIGNMNSSIKEEDIENKDDQNFNKKISDLIIKHINDIEHNIQLLKNSDKEKNNIYTTDINDNNATNSVNNNSTNNVNDSSVDDINSNITDNVSYISTDNVNNSSTDNVSNSSTDNVSNSSTDNVSNSVSDSSTDHVNSSSNYKYDMNSSDDKSLNGNKKDEKKKSDKINSNIKFSEICKLVLQNAVIEAKKKKKIFVNIIDILLSLINVAEERNNDFLKYLNELNISVNEFKNQLTTYDEINAVVPFNKNMNDMNINTPNNEYNNQKTHNMSNDQPNQIVNGINNEYLNQSKDYKNNDENNFAPNNKLISSSFMKDCLIDMVQLAQEKGDEHFFGRKKEIKRIIEILGRKKKSNPLLIGESGVGKTAIIEHLSYLILKNKIPNHLKNCRIFQLNVGNIVAGTKYRGEFEEKMKHLLLNMNKKKKNILFIDEIHVIVGAGSGEGSLDASNLLKPFLSSDNLQCIGTTTFQEFSKYIENDKALRRRFNCITINPFSPKETYQLLKKIKYNYEKYHNIYYTNESLKSIVLLSEDYLPTLNLPDKAIDILDEAGAYQKIKYEKYMKQKSKEKFLEKSKISMKKDENDMRKQKIENNNNKINKEGYIKEESNNELINKEEELEEKNNDKISKIEDFKEEKNDEAMNLLENMHMKYVTSDVIENIVSKKSSISFIKKNKKEEEKISKLKEKLNKIIIGQEKVIDILSKYLFKAITNIKDPNKPIGTLLLCGSSGVGKTLCAQVISKYLFNDDNLIVINMSEYIDKHSVSKLFGSYPGYVGYKEGGELTESVKKKPFSIILFDEIEKAHSEVLHVLLQILDNGLLTDSKGNKISFKNTFIFMTTNIGSDIITDYFKLYNKNYSNLGFKYYIKNKTNVNTNSSNEENKKYSKRSTNELNEEEKKNNKSYMNNYIEDFEEKLRSNKWYEELEPEIEDELKKRFLPEFLNRIDEKIIFRQFLKRDIISILENMIDDLKKRIKKRKNLNLIIDKDVINYICSDENNIYDMNFGARSIRRALYKYIEDPIASFLISNLYEPNDSISLNLSKDKKIYVKLLKTSVKQLS